MAKQDKDIFEMEGEVYEVLPNQMYKVQLLDNNEHIVMCYTGGRMRQNKIRIVQGDRVLIEMSPYDLEKGRLVKRL